MFTYQQEYKGQKKEKKGKVFFVFFYSHVGTKSFFFFVIVEFLSLELFKSTVQGIAEREGGDPKFLEKATLYI